MELLQRLPRLASKKLIDLCRDQITHMAKSSQSLLLAPGDRTWIREPPMNLLPGIGKERASFSRLITDSDDEIHRGLCRKFLNALGTMSAEIYPDLRHGPDRQWVHRSWLCSCAKDFVGISST